MTTKAQVADVLTASRVLLAMLLAVAVAAGSFPTATVVLVVAWLTDLLDGRLARAATSPTRLGAWDFRIDVSLGAAILVGLFLAGLASPWLVVPAIAFLAGLTILTGNPAPAMLLLAFAYAWFLWILLDLRPLFWWLPFASILILLILDWHRFTTVILPAFFRGLPPSVVPKVPTLDPFSTAGLDPFASHLTGAGHRHAGTVVGGLFRMSWADGEMGSFGPCSASLRG